MRKRFIDKMVDQLESVCPNASKNRASTKNGLVFYWHGLFGSGKEYGMSIYDLDEIAWICTLLGYLLSWEDGLELIHACWDLNDENAVLNLGAKDKNLVMAAAKEAGLKIDFSRWVSETPETVTYYHLV